MKIRMEHDVMAEAVAWAARSLPSRPSVPVLAGLLISASGDSVTMISFDYETSAEVKVNAQVIDEGEVLVSGKLLAEIARTLPNRPVDLTSNSTSMELVCGSARFTLQLLPVDDYPSLPQMPEPAGVVDSTTFRQAINQVVIAAGKDELIPVFTGVRLEIEGDRLSLLATDRYRMALRELTWNPASPSQEATALVPARVLNEAARSISSGEEITLALAGSDEGESLIGMEGSNSNGQRQLTTRLLSGEFPKVRHLMDIKPTVTVSCKTEELIDSVKRVSLVAERNTPLRMLIEQDRIALEAASGDQAQASEAVAAQVISVTGGELSMNAAGFNPHYLADALSAIDSPYVHFSFTAPGKACLVRGVDHIDGDPKSDYRHVIMLMRLPN